MELSPTCEEIKDHLEENPDICSTVNELTRLNYPYRSNWRSVKNCLRELEEMGIVDRKEKCVKKADCYQSYSGQLREECPDLDQEKYCEADDLGLSSFISYSAADFQLPPDFSGKSIGYLPNRVVV